MGTRIYYGDIVFPAVVILWSMNGAWVNSQRSQNQETERRIVFGTENSNQILRLHICIRERLSITSSRLVVLMSNIVYGTETIV